MTGTTSLHFIGIVNLSLLSSFKPTTPFKMLSDKSVEFFFFESDCNLTKALVDLNCTCLLSFGCLILPVYLRCSSVFTRDCIMYYKVTMNLKERSLSPLWQSSKKKSALSNSKWTDCKL